ncbi:MAG: hypothetical protein MSG64_20595, partial [Pyrinomonadaceae bacterium MAG19_C2-C3]|nr:hypothetical protein [Pyrinomonadaceae bacterium MAG19_C2-C3]
DLMTLQQASDIPARVWGYSICVCVDRSPGHQFKRLSYVLEQAKNDWESYKEQGIDKDERMQEMMLRMSLKRIKQARESGEWLSTSKQSS